MGIAAGRAAALVLLCAGAGAGCAPPAAAVHAPVTTEAQAAEVARQALRGAPGVDEPFVVQLDSIGWLVTTAPHRTPTGQTRYLVRIDRTSGRVDVGFYSVARTAGAD